MITEAGTTSPRAAILVSVDISSSLSCLLTVGSLTSSAGRRVTSIFISTRRSSIFPRAVCVCVCVCVYVCVCVCVCASWVEQKQLYATPFLRRRSELVSPFIHSFTK